MLVLGIETSCDETALAVVRDGEDVVSSVVSSSLDLHKEFGGIIPEIASRRHLQYITEGLKKIKEKVDLKEVDLIAVTYGPGLAGSLLIGLSCAKALSICLGIDLIGVDHLKAHLYAPLIQREIEFPFIGLVVSGGHTVLVKVKDYLNFEFLGQTKDDAAGEAFDKVAKILNLGYPGGPVIDKISRQTAPGDYVKFTRPFLKDEFFNFSFSGIKTAVLYYVKELSLKKEITKRDKNRIAAGFQEAVIDVLAEKAIGACRRTGIGRLVVGGGVSANLSLREKLNLKAEKESIEVVFPSLDLSVDNAVMVAGYGYHLYRLGQRSDLSLKAQPNSLLSCQVVS